MNLDQIREKYYPALDEETFWQVVRIDPTYRADRPQKRGCYTAWLLNLSQHGLLPPEDYPNANEYLAAFHTYKRHLELRDIGSYRQLPDLYDAVAPYLQEHPLSLKEIKREEAETVYTDDRWTVVIPRTWDAAQLYGAGTRWCTSSRYSPMFFHSYTADGDLYINIDRASGRKYQFLVLRDGNRYQYCYDQTDRRVFSGDIGLSDSLVDLYNQRLRFDLDSPDNVHYAPNLVYAQTDITSRHLLGRFGNDWRPILEEYHFDRIDTGYRGFVRCVESRLGRCFIDLADYSLIRLSGCDFCNEFNGSFAVAWRHSHIGVLDRQGHFHAGMEHARKLLNFCHGVAPVRLKNDAYNIIDTEGHLRYDVNFGWCGDFHEGLCRVTFHDGSKGYIDTDGREIYRTVGPCTLHDFRHGLALVFFRNGKNLLRPDGTLLFDRNVAGIEPLGQSGISLVTLPDGHYTFVDTRTGRFTPHTFLTCRPFVMGMAAVRTLDGTWNYLKATDGELLLSRGVDWCNDFDPAWCAGKIMTYRGENYVNTDGELLRPWSTTVKRRRK